MKSKYANLVFVFIVWFTISMFIYVHIDFMWTLLRSTWDREALQFLTFPLFFVLLLSILDNQPADRVKKSGTWRTSGNMSKTVWRAQHAMLYSFLIVIFTLIVPLLVIFSTSRGDHINAWWGLLPLYQGVFILRQFQWMQSGYKANFEAKTFQKYTYLNSSALNTDGLKYSKKEIRSATKKEITDLSPTPEEVREAEINPWPGHTMRETIQRNREQNS